MINECAQCCIMAAQFTLRERPISLQKTKRLLDDLLRIRHLIARNENLDPIEIDMSIRPRPDVDFKTHFVASYDRAQRMQHMLRGLNAEIADYLQSYELQHTHQRNSILSHEFIRFMFVRVWPDLRFKNWPMPLDEDWFQKMHLPKRHHGPFSQFLAAAWRDVGFPMEDHRGHSREPLESWFADRVRQVRFGSGIYCLTISIQIPWTYSQSRVGSPPLLERARWHLQTSKWKKAAATQSREAGSFPTPKP